MAAKRNKRQRRLVKQRRQTQRLLNPKPKQLRKERKAMARLEYRPVIKAAQDQIRISKTSQRQLNQFYKNYRGAVANTANKSDANTQRLYEQSRDTAADLGKRYDDKINQLAADDAKSAALRGASVDSGNQQRSLAGESQRQNLMNADSKLLSQLGASSSAYLRNVALASRQGQRLDNRRERNTRQNARNDIRDARKERNAKVNTLRAEQRQAERDWRIQKAAFGPKGYNAAMRDQSLKGLQSAKITAGATRDQSKKTLQGKKVTAGAMRAQGRGGGGGGGYSRGEIRTGIAHINQAISEAENPKKYRRQAWRNPGKLRTYLISKKGLDPKLARIAVRRWRNTGPRPGSKAWTRKNKQRSGR